MLMTIRGMAKSNWYMSYPIETASAGWGGKNGRVPGYIIKGITKGCELSQGKTCLDCPFWDEKTQTGFCVRHEKAFGVDKHD